MITEKGQVWELRQTFSSWIHTNGSVQSFALRYIHGLMLSRTWSHEHTLTKLNNTQKTSQLMCLLWRLTVFFSYVSFFFLFCIKLTGKCIGQVWAVLSSSMVIGGGCFCFCCCLFMCVTGGGEWLQTQYKCVNIYWLGRKHAVTNNKHNCRSSRAYTIYT